MLQTTLTDRLLEIGHATESGVSNKKNDDAYLIFPAFYLTDIQASRPVPVHVAIVADGEGEHGTGGVASQLAVEKMYSVITESQTTPIPERISEAIERANFDIYQTAQGDTTLSSMQSTTVVVAVVDSEAYFAHVGDCQAYVLRENTLWRLTRNQKNVHPNAAGASQAATDQEQSLGNVLGEKPAVFVDQLIVAPPELAANKDAEHVRVNRSWLPLQPQDVILLASKGLTDVLDTDSIQGILELYPPQEAANQLVAKVTAAGGSDNVTVIAMHWNGEAAATVGNSMRFSRPIGILVGALLTLLAVVVWWVLSSNMNVSPIDPAANTPGPSIAEGVVATTATEAGSQASSAAITETATVTSVVGILATPTLAVPSPSAEASPAVTPGPTEVVTNTQTNTTLQPIAIVPTEGTDTNDENLFVTVEPPTPGATSANASAVEVAIAPTGSPTVDLTATASAEIGSVRSAVAATLTALPPATEVIIDTPRPTSTSTSMAATSPTSTHTVRPTDTSTPRPTSTPTIDAAATQTVAAELLASSLAATLTAMPTFTSIPTSTATETPDVGATQTAESMRLATSIAATLTAQPTATPTQTNTPTATNTPEPTATNTPQPTDTPTLRTGSTSESTRLALAITATVVVQPTSTATSTSTSTSTATSTSTKTPLPTATNTPSPTNTPQPTATHTATPNLNATATSEARRLALAVAATLTAQPTATATSTSSPTPLPSATQTPNIDATRTVEVRQLATSIAATLTARPTLTPSRTPRPTSTSTVVATSTIAATSTTAATPTTAPTEVVAPTATPYVPPANNGVQLLNPPPGTTVNSPLRFEWQSSFVPEAGSGFELVLWREGQDPMSNGFGLAAPTSNTNVLADLPSLDGRLGELLEPGNYRWGILLVQTEPYQRLQYLGQGFPLRYERSGGGSGGGSSSGGVSSGE